MSQSRDLDPCTIALHPVHDARHRHVADRLVYRQQGDSDDEDTLAAAARALTTAVYELGDAGLLAERVLYVTLPLQWLARPELLPTPANRLALGVAEARTVDDALLQRLDDIRERGYRTLMPYHLVRQAPEALLPRTDIVQLASPDELDADTLKQLREHELKLLVENIQSAAELERYQALGCDYYNGSYLARPSFIASQPRGRHGNRTAQIRLIRALYEDDNDIHRLQQLVVQMPHLHVAILRRANSSYYNRGGRVVDLGRGMQVLGMIELRRLILTLTLASLRPSSHIVLRMALIRAFMCRNLAAPFPDLEPEDAFNTGLFSLMDALLEENRDTLFTQLPLKPAIIRAVSHREGPLGALLTLSEGHERQLEEMPSEPPPDQLHRCYIAALESTRELMSNL